MDKRPEKPVDELTLTRYLKANSINFQTIEPFSGGTANYVFLIMTNSGVSQIIKHAEPYVKSSNGAIPFPVDRMNFEHKAMEEVAKLITPEMSRVRVPKMIRYDEAFKVLMMSYAGKKHLKDAYGDPELDIPRLGRQLGEWLATLHQSTKETNIGEDGNPIGKTIYRWAYSHLAQVAEQYELDVEFSKHIDEKYGSLLQTDDDCVCHGDFWPGNVLVGKNDVMTVVDWEMCRRGCGATDVGQFSAEAYLLDKFCGGRGLRDAFLQGYYDKLSTFGVVFAKNLKFMRRMAVHMGVHLAFWPASVKWAGEEETKATIEFGHKLMRDGDKDELEWSGMHELAPLLGM